MTDVKGISTKRCLLCHKSKGRIKKNDTLHWHRDPETGALWVYCVGVCQRGYSIYEYTARAGLSLREFLKQDFDIKEAPPNEVNKMDWPQQFVTMFDKRAADGLEYIKSRYIAPAIDMYFDIKRRGIVFPYYYSNVFCGAQIRFIKPFVDKDGNTRKVDTLPGTRLGLLFYNWNQDELAHNIKTIIVTEGAFNALAIQQSFHEIYGGEFKSPFRCVALSGSGVSKHQLEVLSELVGKGYSVIAAPDSDKAGIKMFKKMFDNKAITHYAFTDDEVMDWNDMLASFDGDKKQFIRWFLKRVRHLP